MLAFHMLCTESEEQAIAIGRAPLNAYLKSLVDGASGWLEGKASSDYPNYDKIIAALSKETFETQREKGAAWIGAPDVIIQQIKDYHASVGGFEIASLQVNFNVMERADAEASMRLFATQVLPYFTSQ